MHEGGENYLKYLKKGGTEKRGASWVKAGVGVFKRGEGAGTPL